jgi:hypothetical protein
VWSKIIGSIQNSLFIARGPRGKYRGNTKAVVDNVTYGILAACCDIRGWERRPHLNFVARYFV